jgi:hypothetical protein
MPTINHSIRRGKNFGAITGVTMLDNHDGTAECPLCGADTPTTETHRHHVLPRFRGGLGTRWNILVVCQSCHMIIHAGTSADSEFLAAISRHYMEFRYGLLFALQYREARESLRTSAIGSLCELRELREFSWELRERGFLCYVLLRRLASDPGFSRRAWYSRHRDALLAWSNASKPILESGYPAYGFALPSPDVPLGARVM